MKYLGKRKLYQLAKQLINEEMCGERAAFYKFYRGSEWLRFETSEHKYELYSDYEGRLLTLEMSAYDEETEMFKLVSRRVVNGFGKIGIAI